MNYTGPEKDRDKVTVSIVVPMYLCEEYIGGALDMLTAQDHRQIEIICVNDGSPDRSLEIAEAKAAEDPRIRTVSIAHGGAGAARKAGIDEARGSYVMFLDADDTCLPTYVSGMLSSVIETGSDIAVCQFTLDDRGTRRTIRDVGFDTDRVPASGAALSAEIDDIFGVISPTVYSKIFSTSLVRENGLTFSRTEGMNDVLFVDTALVCAKKISFVNEELYCYRKNENVSSISSFRAKNRNDIFTVYNELYSWLKARGEAERLRQSFCRAWGDTFTMCAEYEVDSAFTDRAAEYLATEEPWITMKDRELIGNAGLTTSEYRTYLIWLKRRSRPKTPEEVRAQKELITRCGNKIETVTAVRSALREKWGRKLRGSDILIEDARSFFGQLDIREMKELLFGSRERSGK